MHYKIPKNRNDIMLFPQVDLWVDQNNSVRLIDLIIDKLMNENPDKFVWKGKVKKGCTSYSPGTMSKLLLYCYFNWIPGSRRMERETYRNLELMWLLGDLHPDHWTICQFRRENPKLIKMIAVEFRKFLKASDYIEGKTVAIDGSKMKAFASPDMLSEQKIKNRLENIENLMDKFIDNVDEIDNLEEQIEEDQQEKQELINKIGKLEKEKNKLEQHQKTLQESGKKYLAPNDPEANLMKSRDEKKACYNLQSGVDAKHNMIAMAEVSTDPNDLDLLKEGHEKLKEQVGIVPNKLLADKGYANTNQIKDIEENSKTKCYVPLQEIASKNKDKENGIRFKYDKKTDDLTCSQGKRLKLKSKNYKQRNQVFNVYQCNECSDCPVKAKCTTSKTGRRIKLNKSHEWIEKYKERLNYKYAKVLTRQRKSIVEHPFGALKLFMGKHCFILTEKHNVQIEIDLYTTVYNIKRLLNVSSFNQSMNQIEEYNWKIA